MRKLSELLARVVNEEDRTAEVSKADPSNSEDIDTLSRGTQRSEALLFKRPAAPSPVQLRWFRLRAIVRTVLILNRMAKDIKRFGLGRNQYAEEYARDEIKVEVPHVDKYLFHPEGLFLRVWTWIIFVLMLYSAFIMPYRVCFEENVTLTWSIVEITVDSLFFLDILVNFNSAVVMSDGVMLEVRKLICLRYVKSWFFFDIVGCLPFSLIEFLYGDSVTANKYNTLVRLLRLPRLYRVTRIFRMSKVFKNMKHSEFIQKLIKTLNMSSGILRLVHFSVAVIIGVHVAGCFWYLLAKIEGLTPDTWVVRSGNANSDNFTLYLKSIYWVFTCMTTVGFGDIVPGTPIEQVCALLVMGFGIAFYSYVVSNLSTILSTLDSRSEFIKARIQALNEFSRETHLPRELHNSIRRHITLTYKHYKLSAFTRDALVNELPAYLMNEVSMHMHKKVVDQIIFFQDKDPTFIAYIIPKLKSETLQIGELLYRQHDYADEMYFLTAGRVHLKAEDGLVFKTYIQGSYFGEIELINGSERECTVQVCSPSAEFLSLSKSNFNKVLKEFPAIASELRHTAQLRSLKNEEAKRFASLAAKPSTYFLRQNNKRITNSRRTSMPDFEKMLDHDKEEADKAVHWGEGPRAQRPPAWRKVSSGILRKSAKNSQVSSTISTREQTARNHHVRSVSEPREDEVMSPKLGVEEFPLRQPVISVKSMPDANDVSPHIAELINDLQRREDVVAQSVEKSLTLLRSLSQAQATACEQLTKMLSRTELKSK